MENEHLFKRSQQTIAIVNYLRALDKGSQVTYAELSRHVGIELSAQHPKVISARDILRNEHGAVWTCIAPKIGLRRLNDVEIAERLQPFWMRGARNKLKKAGKEIEVVDRQALDINQLARFGVDCIQRELGLNSLSRATRAKMDKVARGTSNDLPSFNIVEWAISLTRPNKPPT